MTPSRKIKRKDTLTTVVIFVTFVVFLVIFSLTLKFISLLSQSSFDGNHQLIFSSVSKKSSEILSFSPDTSSISVLAIPEKHNTASFGKLLEVPIHGSVQFEEEYQKTPIKNPEDVDSKLGDILSHYPKLKTNLTTVDFLRLWYYTKTIPSHNITIKQLPSSREWGRLGYDDEHMDKVVSQLFTDSSLVKEKLSIQIVNGTEVSGMGNRLARLVQNIGGNIVSLETSDIPIEKSRILYSKKESYTTKRLERILKFPIEKMQRASVSDIIIELGKDSANTKIF